MQRSGVVGYVPGSWRQLPNSEFFVGSEIYIHGQESSLAPPPPPTTSSSLPKSRPPYLSTFVNLNILLTGGHSGLFVLFKYHFIKV
uniref:Uncharacterized protein n=1 Tax=Glossina palpalis gambiensis TaxID=67801 RepID=A0A1B0BMJ0_9MUSC